MNRRDDGIHFVVGFMFIFATILLFLGIYQLFQSFYYVFFELLR